MPDYAITADDDINTAQAKIQARESGGRNVYNAEGSDASGYYQFRPNTWREGMALAGVQGDYPEAIKAPREVQDQVFRAVYQKYGETPWIASAPGYVKAAKMADSSTDTTTPAPATIDMDQLQKIMAALNPQQQAASGGDQKQSFVSLLGSALGGGGTGFANLSPAQKEAAGTHALAAFGANMLANSGYSRIPRTFGEIAGGAFGAAQQSMLGSDELSMQLAHEQQQNQLERVRSALSYLTGANQNAVARGTLGVEQGRLKVEQDKQRLEERVRQGVIGQRPLIPTAPEASPTLAPSAPPAAPVVPSPSSPSAGPPVGAGMPGQLNIPPSGTPVQTDKLPAGPAVQTGLLTPPTPAVQVAGPGAPTTTVPPTTMPGTQADVQAILGGMKQADGGGDKAVTQVADQGGFVYKPSPPPPEQAAMMSGKLSPQDQADFAKRERDALSVGDFAKAEAVRKEYTDARIKAQQDAQKVQQDYFAKDFTQQSEAYKSARHPATPSELAEKGIQPEPGVYWQADNFGNLEPKQTPVDPRLQELARVDQQRYIKDYAEPHDQIAKVRPIMEQMDALRRRMIASGNPGASGGIGGDYARRIQGALVSAGLAPQGIREDLSDQQAYEALANQVVLALKSNVSLGQTSDRDLAFLQDSAATLSKTLEGQEKISAMVKQIWDHQDKVFRAATDTVHDRGSGYTLGGLQDRLDKLGPAIPTLPEDYTKWSPDKLKAWKDQNGIKKGGVFYLPWGDPMVSPR